MLDIVILFRYRANNKEGNTKMGKIFLWLRLLLEFGMGLAKKFEQQGMLMWWTQFALRWGSWNV